ncbi:MAG TPA: protein phosphatase CheZ [Solimonas sp.]|nr:protein phosphatase CheZ [Solimonas sp.]
MNAVVAPAPESVAMDAATRASLASELRALLANLESADDAAFASRFDQLVRSREEGLFAHVARLTRQLHSAVTELRLDQRLTDLAGAEIPDARSRLDYVMRMTEQAAHRTLDLVEAASNQSRQLAQLALRADPALAAELAAANGRLRAHLSELAQAQEYQDLTGQIIKRVMTLVQGVESALLELLCAAGRQGLQTLPARPIAALPASGLAGPAVPGLSTGAASQQDADELLASLGF